MFADTIDQFYAEVDVFTRKNLLKDAIASGEYAEDNEIRRQIYNYRYLPKKATKNDKFPYLDTYYVLWIPLTYHQKNSHSERQFKKAKKEILKQLEEMHFIEMRNSSERHQELLFWECVNFFRNLIGLSREDKTYSARLFGFSHLKGAALDNKIAEDIRDTAIDLPKNIKLEEEMKPFIDAARYAIEEAFMSDKPEAVEIPAEDSVQI